MPETPTADRMGSLPMPLQALRERLIAKRTVDTVVATFDAVKYSELAAALANLMDGFGKRNAVAFFHHREGAIQARVSTLNGSLVVASSARTGTFINNFLPVSRVASHASHHYC